jgi:uncharacterized protein
MQSAELQKSDALLALIRNFESCAVAFSGGVDSAVVAKAAQLAVGDKAVAVTGNSASVAAGELAAARELAQLIGIRHEVIATGELSSENYTRNAADRCYHCKSELYQQLDAIAESFGASVVVSGANVDDLGDYRPGLTAAQEHAVRHPLAECGFTKADVRALAAHWELPVWDKPASPCLSSRIAYGEEVTPERLAMIDRGEQYLRSLGLREVRVRYHRGDVARLEVPTRELQPLCDAAVREPLVAHFRRLGFKFIALDLEGFRSGSLNQLVTLD